MILVTGATGILGRVIVLELLKKGKKVRAAKRKSSNLEEVKQSFSFYTDNSDEAFANIEWVDVDFDEISSLTEALKGVEEVYHCAAKVSFHPDERKEIYHTNINGTKNLLFACEGSSVKKFCFVSSIAVLDGLNEKGEMDEDSNYNSKIDHSAYSKSKHFSEMEVWRASAEGLQTVIVNPGMIIGSGNWNQSSGELFSTLKKNNFTGKGGTSYVDVRDVAKIAIALMDQNVFGERFVLISENMSYKAFGKMVRQYFGLKGQRIFPDWLLTAGRALSFLFGWLVPSLKMANKVNIEAISNFNKISNEKIKQQLGYTFIPVEESVDFHVKNYINSKK